MEKVIASISTTGQAAGLVFRRLGYVILVAAVALIVLLTACASPMAPASPSPTLENTPVPTPRPTSTPARVTPTPRASPAGLAVRTYVSEALGVQLSYPSDWLLRETENGLVIGTSERVIAGGELEEGAGLVLQAERLPNAEWENLDELARDRASVFSSEAMEIGQPEAITIGGKEASVVTVEGLPPLGKTPIQGMVAAAIWDRWLYSFVAVSVADEWSTYGAPLQTIVEGVHFLTREAPEWPPDAWEPDDTMGDASTLVPGAPQVHNLHRSGDMDYVSFEATRGYTYTVETAELGDDLDTRIFLYDCQGRLLAQDDDGRARQEAWASRLVWTAEHTCAHYVMVHDLDDDAGPATSYEVRIWERVGFTEDEYEPDDSPSQATLISAGEVYPHNLHGPGDQDWSRIEVQAGYVYILKTSRLGAQVDTVLHLLDEAGKELAVDDNGREEEEPLASRIRWAARRDATLYILVHDQGDDAAGPGTEYWLSLSETSPQRGPLP